MQGGQTPGSTGYTAHCHQSYCQAGWNPMGMSQKGAHTSQYLPRPRPEKVRSGAQPCITHPRVIQGSTVPHVGAPNPVQGKAEVHGAQADCGSSHNSTHAALGSSRNSTHRQVSAPHATACMPCAGGPLITLPSLRDSAARMLWARC